MMLLDEKSDIDILYALSSPREDKNSSFLAS
jgi:hypothetical protein